MGGGALGLGGLHGGNALGSPRSQHLINIGKGDLPGGLHRTVVGQLDECIGGHVFAAPPVDAGFFPGGQRPLRQPEQPPDATLIVLLTGQTPDVDLRLFVGVNALLQPARHHLFQIAHLLFAAVPAVGGGHQQVFGGQLQRTAKIGQDFPLAGGKNAPAGLFQLGGQPRKTLVLPQQGVYLPRREMPPAADGGNALLDRLFGRLGGGGSGFFGLRGAPLGEELRLLPVLQAVVYLGLGQPQPPGDACGIHGALPLPQRQQQHLQLRLAAKFQMPVGHRRRDGKNAAPRAEIDRIGHSLQPSSSSMVSAGSGGRPQGVPAPPEPAAAGRRARQRRAARRAPWPAGLRPAGAAFPGAFSGFHYSTNPS